MRLLPATLSLTLILAACGSPTDEDKLTADEIRASETAPELPEINLSENPEPAPTAPPVAEPGNDLGNMLEEGENETDDLAPLPADTASIPASFQGRWGMTVDDCTDPRREESTALVVSSDRLELRDARGQLFQVLGNYPERFIGLFAYNGDSGRWSQKEELSLTASSNVLIRDADGERFRYRRCTRPRV